MSEQQTQKTEHQPPFNTLPAGLEKAVANFYSKSINLNLPVNGRKWLADNVWWIALVGGILSLWGAWSYWQVAHYASDLVNWANQISQTYGGSTTVNTIGFTWYLVLAAMAAQAALFLLAFQQLKVHKKSGWNLLFYASYVSVLTGVFYLFVSGYGFGNFIGMVIGTLIGWFFLFQIRSYFVK